MKEYIKETVDTYNDFSNEYDNVTSGLVLEEEIVRFEKLLPGKNILEIGCGPGRDAAIFSSRGFQVTGIDITPNFIKMAKSRVPAGKFFVMDVLDMKFNKGSFDGVWAVASLHHLKRDDFSRAISMACSALKKGGILFLTLKAGIGEGFEHSSNYGNRPRFFTYFSKAELKSVLQACGFEIIDCFISNERKRFGEQKRDIDFVACFARKL